MHIARQIIAGAGALMAAALITLISMMQSQWVKDHPTDAQRLGIALLVGAIVCFIFWMAMREEQPSTAIKNEGNFVGRDNNGKLIGHVEHYHEAEKDKLSPIQTKPDVAPGFTIRPRVTHIVYELSPGCWRECPQDSKEATRALVVDVMRDVPPPGPPTKHSVLVLAILKFSSVGTEQIPRAYWIDRQDYRASFIVGHKESLVVGTYEEPYLASYTNPRFGELMEDQFPILPVRQLGQRTIMAAIPFTLEISLWDWYANSTIQQNKVAVEIQDGRFLVTWCS
ncbi:MAG: hypothetical protein P4K93_06325 [Terracidiphilus sp.]|nr:hypothetical protein [Terracidiphilus sp.]